MDRATDLVLLAVAILLVCSVLTTGFELADSARRTSTEVNEETNSLNERLEEREYTKYLNRDVTGNEVLSACRTLQGKGVTVSVVTMNDGNRLVLVANNTTTDNYASNNTNFVNFQNLPTNYYGGKLKYVNPNANFTAAVERKANGLISGIRFSQKDNWEVGR